MLLQITVYQGQGLLDEHVDVQPASDLGGFLEVRPDAFHHGSLATAIRDDRAELLPRSIELGQRSIKPPQACLGSGHDRGQRLFDFVSDRRCYCIASNQTRAAFTTLSTDSADQARINYGDLVKQDKEDEAAGQQAASSAGIPAKAEAR